jgi:hypothetical protein
MLTTNGQPSSQTRALPDPKKRVELTATTNDSYRLRKPLALQYLLLTASRLRKP